VHRLDRLARKLYVQLTVVERLEKAGARVVSTSEPDIDGSDELRELIRNILGSVAGYERAVIRGRMLAGRRAKSDRGGFIGGIAPFGYKALGGELIELESEQAVVARVATLRAQGASLRAIAQALDAEGCGRSAVRAGTLRRSHASWSESTQQGLEVPPPKPPCPRTVVVRDVARTRSSSAFLLSTPRTASRRTRLVGSRPNSAACFIAEFDAALCASQSLRETFSAPSSVAMRSMALKGGRTAPPHERRSYAVRELGPVEPRCQLVQVWRDLLDRFCRELLRERAMLESGTVALLKWRPRVPTHGSILRS